MPRTSRMLIPDEKTVYHVISRSTLVGLPIGDLEKDTLVGLIQQFSRIYFTEVVGYSVMGSHFHLLTRMLPENKFSDNDIRKRYKAFWGDDKDFSDEWIPGLRKKWSSLSEFVKDIKQNFTRYYNKKHNHKGTFWTERFKSIIIENGETLINCLAYIDLNAVRAGIVDIPEDYRCCSLGYHAQTGNDNDFLSLDFGLMEFGELDADERFRRYRRYVYETGAVNKPGKSKVIDEKIIAKERKNNFEISRYRKFKFRTRYFTESWIMGSKDYVATNYQRFKDMFHTKKEKIPNPIEGFKGIYSLKKLTE